MKQLTMRDLVEKYCARVPFSVRRSPRPYAYRDLTAKPMPYDRRKKGRNQNEICSNI